MPAKIQNTTVSCAAKFSIANRIDETGETELRIFIVGRCNKKITQPTKFNTSEKENHANTLKKYLNHELIPPVVFEFI